MTTSASPSTHYIPQLPSFGDRLLFVRTYVLRISRLELAEKVGYPHSTIRTWENGTLPHDQAAVAQAYARAAQAVEPRITRDWLLYGNDFRSPLYVDVGPIDSHVARRQTPAREGVNLKARGRAA